MRGGNQPRKVFCFQRQGSWPAMAQEAADLAARLALGVHSASRGAEGGRGEVVGLCAYSCDQGELSNVPCLLTPGQQGQEAADLAA